MIKTLLHADTGISPCNQDLVGWRIPVPHDNVKLNTLNLPKNNKLYLFTPDVPDASPTPDNPQDNE